jgi:formylmethanofuran dehydrogenase subunit A
MQQMNDTSAQADIPGKGMDREQEKDAKIEELRQRLMQGGEDSLAVKAGAQLAVGKLMSPFRQQHWWNKQLVVHVHEGAPFVCLNRW